MSDLIGEFSGITGASHDIAEQYLARNGSDLKAALDDYYEDAAGRTPTPARDSHPGHSGSSSKFRTMSEMINHEERDDDDDEDKNFFTGGEKSGLQVEKPDKDGDGFRNRERSPMNLVEDLMKKAEREAGQPDTRQPIAQPPVNRFKGNGYTLGSEENSVESSKIEDPNAAAQSRIPDKVTRKITFWKEGFQVEDGELYRYDDPENAEYLKQLGQGRAPLSLLNVEMYQDVDVHVIKKVDESYVPPKRKVGGFHGEGHRLGSPVPGEPLSRQSSSAPSANQSEGIISSADTAASPAASVGDSRVQIRLAAGGRLVHSFNSTDSVSTVYDFVAANTSDARPWSLAFAFPLKYIDDQKDKTVKEAGLANTVIVQRWK